MDVMSKIDAALAAAVGAEREEGPPLLRAAMQHAGLGGGATVRPRLCLAVAEACGVQQWRLAFGAALAIELMHCASLVHDDLPCFDDADERRGKPSVHRSFGEPLAVLTGDALIVTAFRILGEYAAESPGRLATLLSILARASGTPHGIVAGQAWESEPSVDLQAYHRAKTAALFVAATTAGAAAAGADPAPWEMLGCRLGEAYQVADDLRDALGEAADLGKPVGRDAGLDRPSAAGALGARGALARFRELVSETLQAVPEGPGATQLQALIVLEAQRLVPPKLARLAA
ncbi:MAG: polyprenyl synthetase family protein [Steroidobacteraceae bacterium]